MAQDDKQHVPWRVGFTLAAAMTLLGGRGSVLQAASYLPLPDVDLARRAPVIVRALVIDQEMRLESLDGQQRVVTLTSLEALEVMKGWIGQEAFKLELLGGRVGEVASWLPGTPSFVVGSEVILFLSPVKWRGSDFSLTEFGLSKFDIVEDSSHRRFAVRPVFSPDEDDELSQRAPVVVVDRARETNSRPLRDAESFRAGLKALGGGREMPEIEYAVPEGELRLSGVAMRPLWVNIGGVEGTSNLFRWFWDTGQSPDAIVSIAGNQTGLTDGSNGLAHVQNAVTQWTGIAGTTVRYSLSAGSAPVAVRLDVESHPPDWTTSLPCGQGGILGLGGPGDSFGPRTFKGEGNYFATSAGDIWMRRVIGGCHPAAVFRSSVLHEMGHSLGLGHPDMGQSIHSTTTPADWANAVMNSLIPPARPDTPQTDDIQAIQYYYGVSGGPLCGRGIRPSCGDQIIRVPDIPDSPIAPAISRRR